MPIKVPAGLPALEVVRSEGMEIKELAASTSDTLRIALLNIMPTKEQLCSVGKRKLLPLLRHIPEEKRRNPKGA